MAGDESNHAPRTFTGLQRKRQTRWTVLLADRISTALITAGGIGTMVAVGMVCVFLAWVVLPLFESAELSQAHSARPAWSQSSSLVHVALDEYRRIGYALFPDGAVRLFRGDTLEPLGEEVQVFAGHITAFAPSESGSMAAVAFDTGHVRLARLGFTTSFPTAADFADQPEIAQQTAALLPGQLLPTGNAVIERTPQGQLRQQRFTATIEAEFKLAPEPIVAIDYAPTAQRIVTCTADGRVQLHALASKRNFLTRQPQLSLRSSHALPLRARATQPTRVLLSAQGDQAYVAWDDGLVQRFACRDLNMITQAEDFDLVPGDARLTALSMLLGRITLAAGDSEGVTRCAFPVRSDETNQAEVTASGNVSADGLRMVIAHQLPGPQAAVTSLGISARNRNVAIGYADGSLRVYYVTTDHLLAEATVSAGQAVNRVLFAPKEDGLLAITPGGWWAAQFKAGHPEVTPSLSSVFLPVWYESYAEPEHVWQSGGGSSDLEAKLGLWPLVFGTLKATFYSMLFGAPLALLAAVYTSEFMHRQTRARLKPVIEVMASLPSVVLGFMAAMVFAPFVSQLVPGMISTFATVPLALVVAAYLWQLLPAQVQWRWQHARLALMFAAVMVGIALGLLAGPQVEQWLFAGNIKAWLLDDAGSPLGGWMILVLPLSAAAWAFLSARYLTPWLRDASGHWTQQRFAAANVLKLLAVIAAALATAWLAAAALAMFWDPRGSFIGPYDDRNALIVGFAMGFAIIPIIYTIAEDALSTVPDHLRSASLGVGATRWQTATRVVIPTAMSGLFSAVMIGLGRAVGETMIMLMAAGNIPARDLNIFNGFRTLSANIATELPEAVQGSTIYRTLFLSALTLFAMTFAINTLAEVVRLRFRRRAYQL